MGDREFLRRALLLCAVAGLMLAACLKHEPMLCGEQEACPSAYVCSDGVCEAEGTRCPDAPPRGESVIAGAALSCEYGQECCCGVCHPSMICRAAAGEELACFYTDACLIQQCEPKPMP